MKPIGALRRDEDASRALPNTWRDACNKVLSIGGKSIENEGGFEDLSITLTYTPIGSITIPDGFVIFSTDNTTSEIGIYRDAVYTVIIKSIYLGFNLAQAIEGIYTYNYKNELIVSFSNGIGTLSTHPYIINLDDLPITLDGAKELVDGDDIELLKLFPSYNQPNYTLIDVSNTGGNLLSGVYYFTIKYLINGNDYTNWTRISMPVSIIDSNPTDAVLSNRFIKIDGCEAGTTTSKSIILNISNLSILYGRFKLGVISKIAGVVKSYEIQDYDIVTDTVKLGYTGFESATEISIDNILVDTARYDKVRTLTENGKRLVIANTKIDDEIKYQKYANMITSEWIFDEEVSLDSPDGLNTYKDPTIIFDKRGFMPGEAYDIFIAFIKNTGEYTEGFHVPGPDLTTADRVPIVGGNDFYVETQKIENGGVFKEFQFADTTTKGAGNYGNMGKWENQDELYPITEDNDFDSTSVGGSNFEGQPVRHHVFPTLRALKAHGLDFFSATPATPATTIDFGVSSTTNPTPNEAALTFVAGVDTPDVGGFTTVGDARIFTFTSAVENVYITVDLSLAATIGATPGTLQLDSYLKAKGSYIFNEGRSDTNNVSITESGTHGPFDFTIGETIEIYGFLLSTTDDFSTVFSATLECATSGGALGGDMYCRILGLKLSNIVIPSAIASEIIGYEIFYAKRNFSNSRVITNGRKWTAGTDDTFVLHPFDLFKNGELPAIPFTYLNHEGYMDLNVVTSIHYNVTAVSTFTGASSSEFMKAVSEAQYLPHDNSSSQPSNADQESRLYATASKVGTEVLTNIVGNIVSLNSFKNNLYFPFNKQDLVSTGKIHLISGAATYVTPYIYGGDVTISLQGVRYLISANVEQYYYMPLYTASNIGYRHEGDYDKQEVYYPKRESVVVADYVIDPVYTEQRQIDNYYGYNNDYNSLNDLNVIVTAKFKNTYVDSFPNRIHRSKVFQSESVNIGWREFLPLEYFDLVNNKGEIVKLFNDDLDLCISTTYSLFIARLKQTLNISQDIVASLGDADIFDSEPVEIVYSNNGYVGNQSQFATITSKIGTLIIDRMQGKIFIYSRGQVDEISNRGLKKWFKSNAEYKATALLDTDNPYTYQGYTAVWDDKYERFIITKGDEGIGNNSYTISYSPNPQVQGWISFHNYTPRFMLSNRNGIYSFDLSKKIYKHNHTSFATYYGSVYPSYIDIVFNNPQGIDKLFNSFNWETFVFNGTEHQWDKTFTSIVVFNYNRHSSKITLVKQSFDAGNVRRTGGTWKFNDFKDVLNDKDYPTIDELAIDELILETLPAPKIETDWRDKSIFMNEFVIIRLIYDNVDQYKFLLNESNVEQVIKQR